MKAILATGLTLTMACSAIAQDLHVTEDAFAEPDAADKQAGCSPYEKSAGRSSNSTGNARPLSTKALNLLRPKI